MQLGLWVPGCVWELEVCDCVVVGVCVCAGATSVTLVCGCGDSCDCDRDCVSPRHVCGIVCSRLMWYIQHYVYTWW